MNKLARSNLARVAAVGIAVLCGWLAQLPSYGAAVRSQLAGEFAFSTHQLRVAAVPVRTVRTVAPALRDISGWISAVGAAVSLADLDADGLANDVCLVDPRSDAVTVAPAPTTGKRFAPFTLDATPLPYDARTVAPMGCLPGDFDENGRIDLCVYFWGRTPILFLRRDGGTLGRAAFTPKEVVPSRSRWNTATITSTDVDGDGHLDLVVGNYFPDGARVLDGAQARPDARMQMQDSMSRATNGGRNRILLWQGPGRFAAAGGAFSSEVAKGWTLAEGAADLNGDLRPELYFANDFGPDRLLLNDSTPGHVRLRLVNGSRHFTTVASKVLGKDSFKGMGIDFGDLNSDGRLDMFVSNITSEYALEESNFAWIASGSPTSLGSGRAPFTDKGEELGLSRSGWGWDAKLGDFNDDGVPEIVQATGFLRGTTDRWPELQELAMANDTLLHHPSVWPRFRPGDDVSGHQHKAFFVRGPAGRWVDLADDVGLGADVVSRGIATADVNGDGALDLAVADQWAPSYLYVNRTAVPRRFLGLRLLLPPRGVASATRDLGERAPKLRARPAVGAAVAVDLGARRPPLVGEIDGGDGHASSRAPELLFGLRDTTGTFVTVRVSWRDGSGVVRRTSLSLRPGWHTILLAQGKSG